MLFSEIRRMCRHRLADMVVTMIRRTNLGDEIGGFILQVWHFNAPWALVTNAALLPRFGALLSLFTMLIALGFPRGGTRSAALAQQCGAASAAWWRVYPVSRPQTSQ